MSSFKGLDFEVELPAGCTDESTYAFALPARANFRPSVVIKTERLKQPTDLGGYVDRQLTEIAKMLPDVRVVSNVGGNHGAHPARTSVYDWGEPARRVRQKQRYIMLKDPERVVTITGTHLVESFEQCEKLFDAVFNSFNPKGPNWPE
jgi:hypothetical protein